MADFGLRGNATRTNMPDWRAVYWSGIIAGIVFAIWEMLLNPLVLGVNTWTPVRMIGAIILGKGALPPPMGFEWTSVSVGVLLHLGLSVIYTAYLGYLIQRIELVASLGMGVLFGLVLYYLNFYVFANLWFGWFTAAQNWISLGGHVVYGLVLAAAYQALAVENKRPVTA